MPPAASYTRRPRRRPAQPLRGYGNTTLSLILALVLAIGAAPVQGTYAYFTNTRQNTGNTITTDTLAAPTGVTSTQPLPSSVLVQWTPSTSSFVAGYDVYRRLAPAAFAAVGSTAAGTHSLVDVPATDGTYEYKVVAKAGTSGAWQSVDSNVATVTFVSKAPVVITPVIPADGSTSAPSNGAILVVFSEPMNPTATAGAFALQPCGDGTTCADAALGAVITGTFTWLTASLVKFQPAALALVPGTSYKLTIGTGAKSATNVSFAAPFTSTFQADAADGTPPAAPAITAPSVETWVSTTPYTLTGTVSEANTQVRVYADADPMGASGSQGAEYAALSTQLTGGLDTFSIDITLTAGANRYFVTATDLAGNVSSATRSALIHQGDLTTYPGAISLSPGTGSLLVTAPFTGDVDSDNSATVRWKTSAAPTYTDLCPGGVTCVAPPVAMSRGATAFTYTISNLGLLAVAYDVEVTYADSDGLVTTGGAATQTASASTISGTMTDAITAASASPAVFAARASQTTAISATAHASVTRLQVVVQPSTFARSLGCLTPGGGGTATTTWDGTTDGTTPVPNDTYTYTLYAYTAASDPSSTCSGTVVQQVDRSVTVSNARSVAMSPPPASVTLTQGASQCVTALVRNSRGETLGDGATVSFSFKSSSLGGAYTITGSSGGVSSATTTPAGAWTGPVTATTGTSHNGCPVLSGSGIAAANLTVDTASTGTLTVTASVASDTAVSGSTTINDPPDAPQGLTLTPGSIKVAFSPSTAATTAGYFVHLGIAPGKYDRKIDIGNTTTAHIEDVIPGQRYWVAVQAYDKLGQTSPMSAEASLVAPPKLPPASITLEATSRTPGAPLRLGAIVRAKVLDSKLAPAGGSIVTFSAPPGVALEQTSVMADVNGEASTTMTITDATLQTTRIQAYSGSATGSLDVTLIPPTPTATATSTPTATPTPSSTPSATATPTPSSTPSATATTAPTSTAAAEATNTAAASAPGASASSVAGAAPGSTPVPAIGTAGDSLTATVGTPPVTSPTPTATVASGTPVSGASGTGTATVAGSPAAQAVTGTPSGASAGTTGTGAGSSSSTGDTGATSGSSSTPAATTGTPVPATVQAGPATTPTPVPPSGSAMATAGAGSGVATATFSAVTTPASSSAPATTVSSTAVSATGVPPTAAAATVVAPTSVPPTVAPPTSVPPTSIPPTAVPATAVPPTAVPPTAVPPTSVPPTAVPPTAVPPTTAPAQPTSAPASGTSSGAGTTSSGTTASTTGR